MDFKQQHIVQTKSLSLFYLVELMDGIPYNAIQYFEDKQ